jgi:hypothetical protein
MFQKVKQLVVRQSHLLGQRLPKQIWVHQENQHHNLLQKKVRQESLLGNREPPQHQLQRRPLVKNLLNLLLLLKRVVPNLLPPRLKDKEEIRRFKNNPLIIKFLVQAHLAVRKPLQYNNRSLLKLVLQSNLNPEQLLLEQVKLSQHHRNRLPDLLFNNRRVL